jgi:hypothetical protein
MNLTKLLLFSLFCMLMACNKPDKQYPASGIILGYDKEMDTLCRGKLLIRLNTTLNGYIATGYPDPSNYQIHFYPQSFKIDTNSIFPISVRLEYQEVDPGNSCNRKAIDITKMVRQVQ